MIYLSIGMPKSGSTLFSWLQKELIANAYPKNGQNRLEELIHSGLIPGSGHFIENPGKNDIIDKLIEISEDFGPILIKSHTVANGNLLAMAQQGNVLITLIHRDPRDVILSAIDAGNRAKNNRLVDDFFTRFTKVSDAIDPVRKFCHNTISWLSTGLVHEFRYADLVTKPAQTIGNFCDLARLQTPDSVVSEIVKHYMTRQTPGIRQFNTGRTTRFESEMLDEDITLCNNELGWELERLGYSLY